MIDIENTILKTIRHKITDLRFLGKYDRNEFKSIMSLIIINDMLEWSDFLDMPQSVLRFLKDWRACHVSKMCFYDIVHKNEDLNSMNVNIPEADYRMIYDDSEDDYDFSDPILPIVSDCANWTADASYEPQIHYFTRADGGSGYPDNNIQLLTTHLKMDIYINRTSGKSYTVKNGLCVWTEIKVDSGDIEPIIRLYLIDHPIGLELITDSEHEDDFVVKSNTDGTNVVLLSINESDIVDLLKEEDSDE